jgi:hypothetical protein
MPSTQYPVARLGNAIMLMATQAAVVQQQLPLRTVAFNSAK